MKTIEETIEHIDSKIIRYKEEMKNTNISTHNTRWHELNDGIWELYSIARFIKELND